MEIRVRISVPLGLMLRWVLVVFWPLSFLCYLVYFGWRRGATSFIVLSCVTLVLIGLFFIRLDVFVEGAIIWLLGSGLAWAIVFHKKETVTLPVFFILSLYSGAFVRAFLAWLFS